MPKTIKYFAKNVWGKNHLYVHPADGHAGQCIERLTGQKTITPEHIALIEALSGAHIKFEEVIAPH